MRRVLVVFVIGCGGSHSTRPDAHGDAPDPACAGWGGSTIVDGGTVLDDGGAFRVYQ
jgi:hypothetical protein